MLNTSFKFGEVINLQSQIEYADEHVNFSNIFNNGNGGVALIGIKAGRKLDTHSSPAEVMVSVIEGEIKFIFNGKPLEMKAGEFLLMGAEVAHSVEALKNSKIMLIKVNP